MEVLTIVILVGLGLAMLIGLGISAFVAFGSFHQSVAASPDAYASPRKEIGAQLTLKAKGGDYSCMQGRRGKITRVVRWLETPQTSTTITCSIPGLVLAPAQLGNEDDIVALTQDQTLRQALTQALALGDSLSMDAEGITLHMQGEKLAQGFLQKRLLAMEELAIKLNQSSLNT